MSDQDPVPTPADPASTDSSDEIIKPGKTGVDEAERFEDGGPKGLEPTRYGDWEKKGRCIDF